MKKLLTLVLAGGMIAFYACGPSKAELEAKEKHKQDSIHMADSMAAAAAAAKEKAKADSVAASEMAMKEKAKADSIAAAEAAAKDKGKAKPKPTMEKKKEEVKKELKKRG
ncbi:MAG: hypothetical protein HY063_04445 [Bacteroidetes bacterium]|nr:hypothetical protein [Bacteroidota bacterium]